LTKKFAGHTLHVKLASRCSRLDFRINGGSSSCLVAPHLLRVRHARLLPSLRNSSFLTRRAINASPPPRGPRELAVCGSSELIAFSRHLHTSSLYTSSPCMVFLLPPVVGPALASALPRRRSLRGRPCQIIAVCGLAALRAGRS
jgi:hypothetical protein